MGQLLLLDPGEAKPRRTMAGMDFVPTPGVGKHWQGRPLVAGFMLPVPDCICNGI